MSDASLHLAPLAAQHLDGCAAIVGRLELFRPYQLTAERARRLLAAALDEGRADLLVVEERGSEPPLVAGFVWFVPRGAFDRSGYLRLIAVDDRFQGRGVGKLLLAELERRHLQRGGIVLLATATNSEAHRFYERLGYQQVGELPDYVKPGLHERIYHKPPVR